MRVFSVAMFFALLLSCNSKDRFNPDCFLNTTVISGYQARNLTRKKETPKPVILQPSHTIRPVSGTVSHHLLCSSVINEWFINLKKLRDVKTFIIISPNHGRRGIDSVSLSKRSWNTAGALTRTNGGMVDEILHGLNIKEDDNAFYNEHGVESLLPYIGHYFPEADIVPILLDEKHKHMARINTLTDVLHGIMEESMEIFLLVSIDFSHGGNSTATTARDKKSRCALMSLDKKKKVISDNNSGLAVMFEICERLGGKKTHIFCHTDSEKFAPENRENITSYFFTFQY